MAEQQPLYSPLANRIKEIKVALTYIKDRGEVSESNIGRLDNISIQNVE